MSALASAIAGKGLENGQYRDLDRDHPELERFKRMIKAGLPQGAIENSLMRDGILPSSLFDTPINSPNGAPLPLKIEKSIPPPPASKPRAPSNAAPSVNAPPPGMSLIDEMKWRQANNKKKELDENGKLVNSGGGIKLPERKKSVVQPQRMVALKPTGGTFGKVDEGSEPRAEMPKFNTALKPALKPTPKGPLPGVNPAAKYTAPVYSSVLRPTTPKSGDKKPPEKVVPTLVKKAADPTPAARPNVDIEFMPGPFQQLLPQTPPEQAVLDDGTKIQKDKSGGYTQINPNGVVIQEFADGARKQTNPDGTVIEVSADGSKTIQTEPDGTRIEQANGETLICFAEGTIIKTLANGEKVQTMTDGTVIHTFPDGKVIQSSLNNSVEITSYPNGSMDQVDKATGKKLHRRADGTVEQLA